MSRPAPLRRRGRRRGGRATIPPRRSSPSASPCFAPERCCSRPARGAPFAGAFSLPGGGVETGETLTEAALRELREEVAVEARIVAFNRHVESIERDEAGEIRRHFVIASFVGRWIAGEGTPGPEAGEVLWTEPAGLSLLHCTPQTAEVVASAASILAARREPD